MTGGLRYTYLLPDFPLSLSHLSGVLSLSYWRGVSERGDYRLILVADFVFCSHPEASNSGEAGLLFFADTKKNVSRGRG